VASCGHAVQRGKNRFSFQCCRQAGRLSSLSTVNPPVDEAAIFALERPHRDLLTYYILGCLVFPPLFPVLILPAYFRYHTMRYKFTEEGVSMSWGILFRRQIIINYARIQDIHLRSNLVERWLGLARVLVQTASGSSGAEMTLEGFKEFEAVRDFLYAKMRGVKDPAHKSATPAAATAAHDAELAAALREVARELRETRLVLQARQSGARDSGHV
jgi:uncharacterized membrane protein YdbT with pleckstrin-like domain